MGVIFVLRFQKASDLSDCPSEVVNVFLLSSFVVL